MHDDGEADPRTVGETPVLNGSTLMLPEQGRHGLYACTSVSKNILRFTNLCNKANN